MSHINNSLCHEEHWWDSGWQAQAVGCHRSSRRHLFAEGFPNCALAFIELDTFFEVKAILQGDVRHTLNSIQFD